MGAAAPEKGRFQLEADQEQHHHDAKLGETHDILSLLPDQPQAERADGPPPASR